MTDVCLVLMPYADIERPSLGLGVLKAALQEQGLSTTVLYPNLWCAEAIGLDAYNIICQSPVSSQLGEWTFSGLAFPDFQPDHSAYFDMALKPALMPLSQTGRPSEVRLADYQKLLWTIRQWTPRFIERVVKAVLKLQPRIVGCSSTFQQHCPSLALLRRIRELDPDIITMLGGANCEGPMGQATHTAFPWVDYVVSGEADQLLGDLCHKLLAQGRDLPLGELPYGVIGPAHRHHVPLTLAMNGAKPPAPRAIVQNMDQIPIPDFDDYFATLHALSISACIKPALAVETSRGCWWGQTHHCTFCGLNGSGMGYRSKSSQRVLDELAHLAERYGVTKFQVADNILDLHYLDTLLPALAALAKPYLLFYEVKANLKREQMVKLAAAGIRSIQPGIESLHDSILKLLDKGNNTLMNIQLLKWAAELGIYVHWSFLANVPGEQDEWYAEVVEWLPLVSHLQPPMSLSQIRYDRFSPYHQRPADYGLKIRPYRTYSYIYPSPPEILGELAYFFEDNLDSNHANIDLPQSITHRPGLNALKIGLETWCADWRQADAPKERPVLSMVDSGTHLTLTDTRPCAVDRQFTLSGLAYTIYKACDQALTPQALVQALRPSGCSWADIEPVVAELCRRKLLLALNDRLLSLAVKEPAQPLLTDHPGGEVNLLEYIRLRKLATMVAALS